MSLRPYDILSNKTLRKLHSVFVTKSRIRRNRIETGNERYDFLK